MKNPLPIKHIAARRLKTVAPRYVPIQDRILLAVNAGHDDAWGCWLTRRLALGALDRLNQYLDQTSALAAKAPVEYRAELADMERENAARTSITKVPQNELSRVVRDSDLAISLGVRPLRKGYVFEIKGREGGHARGFLSRPELQAILLLIEDQAMAADWLPNDRSRHAVAAPATSASPKRRLN